MERMAETECERSELNLGSRVPAQKNCSNNALLLKLLEGTSLQDYLLPSEEKDCGRRQASSGNF